MSKLANFGGDQLPQAIIEELLLVDSALINIPGGGKGVYIGPDHALLWSTKKTYQLVQGDWIEISPASIPLADYLQVLRESLANRQKLIQKRIAKLSTNLEAAAAIIQAAEAQNLEALTQALNRSRDLRKVPARNR